MKLYKTVDFISWLMLIIAIGCIRLNARNAENIISGLSFIWKYSFLGAVIFALFTFVFYKYAPGYYEGEERRASAILSQLFSSIIFSIFLNLFYTYESGKTSIYFKEVIVTDLASNTSTGARYVHFIINGKEERFSPPTSAYKGLSKGDTLVLSIGKGENGFEFIDEFNKK